MQSFVDHRYLIPSIAISITQAFNTVEGTIFKLQQLHQTVRPKIVSPLLNDYRILQRVGIITAFRRLSVIFVVNGSQFYVRRLPAYSMYLRLASPRIDNSFAAAKSPGIGKQQYSKQDK